MNIKLIDRWDDIEGNKYLTLDIGNNEWVDVKRSIEDDGWYTYIMDCENGYEVYKDGEVNGCRHTTWDEEKEIMDFVAEQFEIETELDDRFEQKGE